MASKRCWLIWVVLFLCLLSFSANVIASDQASATQFYGGWDEMGRRLLKKRERPPCKRGRTTIDVGQGRKRQTRDNPRCHNYL